MFLGLTRLNRILKYIKGFIGVMLVSDETWAKWEEIVGGWDANN